MKRENRGKTTRYSSFGVKNSRNSGKMGCVFRTEIWFLIDIRRREDCLFLGRLKSIFGWGRLAAERT